MASLSKGNGYSKGSLIKVGNPIILYGRLYTNYETVIEIVDTFAEIKGNSVLSQGGEVIVPSSGETAEDIASITGCRNFSFVDVISDFLSFQYFVEF